MRKQNLSQNLTNSLVPWVVERTGREERVLDIFSRILKDRIIFIGSPITDSIASLIIAQFLFLYSEDRDKDIELYINSPGGIVTAGLAIYDTMQYIGCDVATYCVGEAASIATLLLAAGARGKRYALPHARIHLHQPSGWATGQAADVRIQAQEILRVKKQLVDILARHTEQSPEKIESDVARDFYLVPERAIEYGIIDEILQSTKKDGQQAGRKAGAEKKG